MGRGGVVVAMVGGDGKEVVDEGSVVDAGMYLPACSWSATKRFAQRMQ